ncbi:hypothetical protein [Acetobacter malorum]|uniref:hypothetical protein n=1 Tax=Acetobacter malorum TaxID=178901 RepID=UPI00117819FE|nr:hypothetical protein [Acetobacter malorum]
MITPWENAFTVGGYFVNPDLPSDGKRRILGYSKSSIVQMAYIFFARYLVSIFSAIFLLASTLAFVLNEIFHRTSHQNILFIFIISACAFFLSIYACDRIHFTRFRVPFLTLPDESSFPELRPLIAALRSGEWEAKTSQGLIPNYVFQNRWWILLFSGADFNERRRWINCYWRTAYHGDVWVRRVSGSLPWPTDKLEPPCDVKNQNNTSKTLVEKAVCHKKAVAIITKRTGRWFAEVPKDQHEAFIEAYIGETHKIGEAAEQLKIVLRSIMNLPNEKAKDTLDELAEYVLSVLESSKQQGTIKTIWTTDSRDPKPLETIKKIIGNGKNHSYDKIRDRALATIRNGFVHKNI